MDKTILVNEDKQAGLELVRALEKAGIPIDGAFWFQPPEWENWRLFIVSPWVSSPGPRSVYQRIRQALYDCPSTAYPIESGTITALDPDDTIYRELASVLTIRPGIMDVDRVTDPAAGTDATPPGEWIGDAFVYRLKVPADIAHAARRR